MRTPFDDLVEAYDAGRPSYPGAVIDALEPRGKTVLDVGAGTGISTRLLASRGARVVAFDLGARPLARLLARGGALGAAVADAHALPVRDASADLVTYAQAWHWVRPELAAPEAVRVLRPGGALAVWWNDSTAQDEPWWRSQAEMLERAVPAYARDYRTGDPGEGLRAYFSSVERHEVPWVRELTVDDYLVFLRSKSYVASLGEGLDAFLAESRRGLEEAFPGGTVREPFTTRLWLARSAR